MLGKIMGWNRWLWAAFGKHPSAKDYFQISLQSPLAQAFAQWVENGFGRIPEAVRRNGVYSWRFWSRGLKKGTLVCGLGKSSGDGVGRPYPLMLLGEGHLDRWEHHWNLLPFVLASAWDRMEYTAARRVEHISQLEADLQRMEAPNPGWKQTLKAISQDLSAYETQPIHKIIMAKIREKARTLEMEQKLIISLDAGHQGDPLQMAGAWHQALKSHYTGTPNTVFMGGSPEKSFLVLYSRPLSPDDFSVLWSM
ncbi:MAG: type VI secretion system-associated protein TagF [Desulfosarcina sp.]|nr:type VI secretion system-associated protein TagF [Desulfosarcina sp.]MBC2741647.1 type VI secretion system-associated protein TagF [Desulfosarcina sp.]MBC2764561.1 type VI secretion system-associated protein TagF [Desulfosarcina sp.]